MSGILISGSILSAGAAGAISIGWGATDCIVSPISCGGVTFKLEDSGIGICTASSKSEGDPNTLLWIANSAALPTLGEIHLSASFLLV